MQSNPCFCNRKMLQEKEEKKEKRKKRKEKTNKKTKQNKKTQNVNTEVSMNTLSEMMGAD